MKALSRTLTLRANHQRLVSLKLDAYTQGENLLETVDSLSTSSAQRIAERIAQIRTDIDFTKTVILALVVLGPTAILFLTAFFLRRFTGAIDTLVNATEQLARGNLSYQIDTPLKDEFQQLAQSFNHMAAALKLDQHQIESLQKMYRSLFENAGESICIIGGEPENLGMIISANNATSQMYGYTLEEMTTLNCMHLSPQDEYAEFELKMARVLQGEYISCLINRCRKDGSVFPVEINAGQLMLDGRKYILSFARDITERKQAEKELLRANQMAVAGQMAVGLAHEIKNPLAGIKASIEVLSDDLSLKSGDKDIFDRVIKEILRMELLLRNLLNYARPPQPQFDLVDLNRLLEHSIKNVEVAAAKMADKKITFEPQFTEGLQQTEVDFSQLQQVFLNIFLNAVDALPENGQIIIRTGALDAGVKLEIEDNGCGIPEATLENIFNPFFTTKSKGTGLGLSICRRLIEQHGGTIAVESNLGKGTKFTIILPYTQAG
jgi:two-component system sensor histidine kinase AtoS